MKKTNIITLTAIILLITIIIITTFFMRSINRNIFKTYTFYQYFAGEKYEYEGTIELTRDDDITQIKFNNIKIDLDSTPIYYNEETKVIFPENMAIVYPIDNGKMYKINRFSNIKQENEVVYLEKQEKSKELRNAFLFDGNNLYFFIEPTTILIEGQEYKLDVLSYIVAPYGGSIELYNKLTDEYQKIDGNFKDVTAITDNYTINISVDSIKYDEKEQLLLKKITNLQNLEV